MKHQACAALCVILLLAGCAGKVDVPAVLPQEPLAIPKEADTRPLVLTKVLVKLHRGDDVGKRMGGSICKERGRMNWRSGHADIADDDLQLAFRETLQQANYPVANDPDDLFNRKSDPRAELRVAGSIDRLLVEPCYYYDNYQDYDRAKGAAYVHVNWQVYDVIAGRVVFETSTEGSFATDNVKPAGVTILLSNAFGAAVNNLLSNQSFHDLVMRQRTASNAFPDRVPIRMPASDGVEGGIPGTRAAIVTIFHGDIMGSGFIISPDGYALTDAHVVGNERFVTVRLASQRTLVGEVLRTDRERDVALIKLSESGLPALKLRLATEPEVADEVYALGTPLDQSLDNTLTRGIVSAYRNIDGLKFIQGDINVHHGNSGGPLLDRSGAVVGLTEMNAARDENGTVKLFTPIGDAVQRLHIRFDGPDSSGQMR